MDFEKIYLLDEGYKNGALRLSPQNTITDFSYVTNGENLEELILKKDEGEILNDVVSLGIGGVFLLSPKALSILEENDIKGWESYQVNLDNVPIAAIKDYMALSIKGECGAIDNNLSKAVTLPPVVPNGPERKTFLGMLFNKDSWDGNDFFSPEGTAFVYVTERVKKIFEVNNISNCSFKKITDLENYDLVLGF